MSTDASAFASLLNIFVEPKKAMEDIRGHVGWLWYPLLLAIGALVVTFVYYYGTTDWDVIRQQQADILNTYHLTRDQIDQSLANLTRTKLIMQTGIGVTIFIVIVYLIQALYLFLAAKVVGGEVQDYGAWLSFTAWTYFPSFLGSLATLAANIAYGKQATFAAIDVTSLNTLIFKLPIDNAWFGLANSLHLALFWTFALMTIGFAAWTKKSLGKSVTIVLAPHVLIYGIWITLKLI